MLNKEIYITSLKLFIITAISALCLAIVNKITAPVIAKNQIATMEAVQREVLQDAKTFKVIPFSSDKIEYTKSAGTVIEGFYKGENNNETVGYVATVVSKNGYGGNIKIMVGVKTDCSINKVKITETNETAGLGRKASNPEFIDQYNGRSGLLSVIKNSAPTTDGSEIAAISGATVTSKAVTEAVNTALELVKNEIESGKPNKADIIDEIKSEISAETEKQLKEGE